MCVVSPRAVIDKKLQSRQSTKTASRSDSVYKTSYPRGQQTSSLVPDLGELRVEQPSTFLGSGFIKASLQTVLNNGMSIKSDPCREG